MSSDHRRGHAMFRFPPPPPLSGFDRSFFFDTAVILLSITLMAVPRTARAIPAFAQQTGQPCAACHVGAFGPQLKQYGRDFKLNGYLASDGKNHGLPIAASIQTSFTHTNADQSPAAAPHFAANDNIALDQLSLYYGGRITSWLGTFAQVTYDGIGDQLALDNTDLRIARDRDLFGEDLVWGVDANDNPTISDLWNSTPAWGFPYNGSALAPAPMAATLIDGGLGERVAGAGGYAMWKDLIYIETEVYRGLGYDVLNAIGNVPVAGTDKTRGLIPYWRAALQHQSGRSYFELGTYGLHASVLPGGTSIDGRTDDFTDAAADANYQFIFNPHSVVSDMISAHTTYIHEDANLSDSQALVGATPGHGLETFRADVSYSFAATYTPTVQYFQTSGTNDAAYWGTPNGSPNSSGMIAEIAYVPWGKPDSPMLWGNIRFAVQYVDYFRFDGQSRNASGNNALYLSIWAAAHF